MFTPAEGAGGTLTFASNVYTYTTAFGAVALYDKALASEQPTQANEGRVTQLTLPFGERLVFTYTELRTPALPATPTFLAHRLQSVTNNLGYQLSFKYASNTADATGVNLTEVTAINNAVAYCDPTANGCGLSGWPMLTFGTDGTAITVTDSASRTWRYALTSGRITGIRWPGSGADNNTVSYSGDNVSQLSNGVGTWSYSEWGTGAAVSDPLNYSQSFIVSGGRVTSWTQPGGATTGYMYDSLGRLTRITRPEGNQTRFTYDTRGNVTETREVAKSGSGLSDIVATATYASSCTNPITCNLPTATTDARGFHTDYTYDAAHGSVLTATSPAPSGAAPVGTGTRPQVRYTYSQLYAYYRNSSGSIVAAPTPVYFVTGTSGCATSSSCVNGADETVRTIGYGSNGVANNRLPLTVSSGSGDASLTATTTVTYDDIGNLLTADGPLSGASDTTRLRYDVLRRRIGEIGLDPDGGGALKHRATRFTYNTLGDVSAVERGTVDSQSDGDWSAFATLETLNLTYDSIRRHTRESFAAGGSTHAVTQYTFDNANRLECVAVRMNPAVFGSLPSSACSLGTEGSNGPDRITRTSYDAATRVAQIASAYGTSLQQNTLTQTWNDNNQVVTIADANGNLTTYEYDGFDRVRKIRFPNASGGGSSTSDYEQYSYDANSSVTQDRRRDGATISYAYDNLSRISTMTPSTGAVVSYAYDNFSRMTQAAFTGHTLTFAYDQLSRNISAGGPHGTVSYQYDVAGRRTRVTWPDSFYAQYDFDLVGAVTTIRENGASSGAGVLASYAYNDLGRRVSVTRGNGVVTSYDYDAAGRLDELVQDLASTANDVTLAFAHNAASQAVSRTISNSGYTWTQPASGYNGATANGLNQIASQNGTSFTYDGRGNLTSTGSTSYSYDVYNRLTGAGSATLAYDPEGRLYQTVGGGVTTRFQYDGADLIAEYNGANVLQRRYVHGPGIDDPIVWYEGSGTSDRRWLLQDRLGSVIAVTNGSGAASSINSYDEYGVPGSSNAGRFQYTGQMWISEADLYHYKARAYAPSLGRFLQSDPILQAGGMNIYAYVGNDPVNATDPSGNEAWVISRPVFGLGSHNFVVIQMFPGAAPIIFDAGPAGGGGYNVPQGALRGDASAFALFMQFGTAGCACEAYSLTALGYSDDDVFWAGVATDALFGSDPLLYNYLAFGCCNSNTYVSTLLKKLGIANPQPAGDYPLGAPGWGATFRHRTLKEMAQISMGHYGIFNWNINSTMLDSAFLTNGMGAAFMRRFQQSEYEQALARIENMPYETMQMSNR